MKIVKKECVREVPKIALCTLGSINWGAFKHPEDMKRAVRLLHRSLNNILDYQDFLSIQSKLSNEDIRPLGIGVTNLAYWHAKRGLKYGEDAALAEVKKWMEHMLYYSVEASVELAQERGKCEGSDRTRYGQGIFPWEMRAEGVNELTDFTPTLDWETLRSNMKQHGVRNATQLALPPVESCQSWRNTLNFVDGSKLNFHQMLEQQGIDWAAIEAEAEPGTEIMLNTPIELVGVNGVEKVEYVVYNGFKSVNIVEFDSSSVLAFTDNHRLLVKVNSESQWKYVFELECGDEIVCNDSTVKTVTRVAKQLYQEHTWDVTTPSNTYVLPNGCVSHNSSVCINSTNGIEMPMKLISTKESKAGVLIQVVPEYHKLKNKYQLMWDQTDCVDYLKTAAVMNAYTDQAISTNTFYSPKHFPDRKVPVTLVAKNLMLAHKWGLRTLYYSLMDKHGAKVQVEESQVSQPVESDDDEGYCEACVL